MGSRLVNVRLDEVRARKVKGLKERGIAFADLVREAIDQRWSAIHQPRATTDVKAILRDIFDRHPDPPDLPPRDYDVHDRRQARDAIRRALRR